MNDYDKIRKSAFDSFEGVRNENSYDPDYMDANTGTTTTVKNAKPGQVMQINLTLNNPTASKIIFNLFDAYNQTTQVLKPELVVGNYLRKPSQSFEGQAAYPNNIDIYDQNGALMIRGNAGDPVATVGCGEYPYRSLVETTKVLGFKIVVFRVSVATQLQFSNDIVHKIKTYAGVDLTNKINVRSNRKLINPILLDIDVHAEVPITGEAGLNYALEPGEAVQIGLYINVWAKPSL